MFCYIFTSKIKKNVLFFVILIIILNLTAEIRGFATVDKE